MGGTMLILMAFITSSVGHKILLHPYSRGFNSHVLKFLDMADILRTAGHEVHLLISSDAEPRVRQMGYTENLHVFQSPASSKAQADKRVQHFLSPGILDRLKAIIAMADSAIQQAEAVTSSRKLLQKLKEAEYDLYICSCRELSGRMLADWLKANTIFYSMVPFSMDPSGLFSPHMLITPFSIFSNKLMLIERVENELFRIALNCIIYIYVFPSSQRIFGKYNLTIDPHKELKVLNLIRDNSAVDFARPYRANEIYIGGAMMSPSRELDGDLAHLAESAVEGLVVVSFGTRFRKITPKQLKTFLNVLGRLKEKVVFSHSREISDLVIPANVFLYDWLPQNDLLGHPNIKLFITHCGLSSIYEAVYHGIPVIAVPMYYDQYSNAKKLVSKVKMGRLIDFHTVTEETLHEAVQDVLTSRRYKDNALRANRTMFDQPVSPRDKFLFYVDYTVRHHGVDHLTHDSVWRLNWVQVINLDVYALLISALVTVFVGIALVMYMLVKMCKKLCRTSKEHAD